MRGGRSFRRRSDSSGKWLDRGMTTQEELGKATPGTRRLAAIMITDMVGYTALMSADEAKALRLLDRQREILRSALGRHGGTLLKEMGDGALSSFQSAVDAVNCAIEIQQALQADPDLKVRIALHIGDVVFTENDVFGDGVNVASRLNALADPGGICVSERVCDDIRNHPDIHVRFIGEKELKNVGRPIRVYVLSGIGTTVDAAGAQRAGGVGSKGPRRLVRSRRFAIVLLIAASIGTLTYAFYRDSIVASLVIALPRLLPNPVQQEIGFCTTSDGVRIAYATSGHGPPVVQVLGWVTHLERGIFSPAYSGRYLSEIGEKHLLVRYDGRGFGLSDRGVSDFSLEARLRDLEAVVDALGLERFALHAISAGGPTAIAYAARHPERVSRIAFYGSFSRITPTTEAKRQWEAMTTLVRTGWGSDNPAYRQMFTSLFMPEGSEVDMRVFNEMQRVSADPSDAAGFISAMLDIDVRDLAQQLRVPVLVLHRRGDAIVPFEAGREIAALIPGARLVTLEGNNHAVLRNETKVLEQMNEALMEFLGEDLAPAAGGD